MDCPSVIPCEICHKMPFRNSWCAIATPLLVAQFACVHAIAQPLVNMSSAGINITTGSGKSIQVPLEHTGLPTDDVVIKNGDVYIHGNKVPDQQTVYKSPKTNQTYLINRGQNGNISVTQK